MGRRGLWYSIRNVAFLIALLLVSNAVATTQPTAATVVADQLAWGAQRISVVVTAPTEALITWTTPRPTRSTLEFQGVVPPYRRCCRVSRYVQAVIYAPEIHGDALSADLIDRDLLAVKAARANAINLYGLGSPGLQEPVRHGAATTLEEYLLRRCRMLQLAVIARIEWYPTTFTFDVRSASPHADADAVLDYYARSIERIRRKYSDVLLYYLVNMPMDDTYVQDRLEPGRFPTAEQQRDYVRYVGGRIARMHPGTPVRVVVHWGALDTIPVARFSDLVDGLALVAYPVRCSAAPFTAGLPEVDCGQTPGPYNGPSLEDPANVVIGKDQLDYWLDKTRFINELTGARGLAMDGVGFAEVLGHWSGIVNDHATKVQAAKWLADYLADEHRTDGFSYFMLHDKDEGSFGILVPSRTVEETELTRKHRVVLADLSPGTEYVLRVVQDGRFSRWTRFTTPDPCPGNDWPRITVTTPPYGGGIVSSLAACQVNWTGNLPEGTEVTVFADSDERGLDGTEVGRGTAGADGAGSATVDLSSLPAGAYYLYCVAPATHCSVPDGRVWDYSSGRIVKPTGAVESRRLPVGQGVTIDGALEPAWDVAAWTRFATHPAQNGGTTADVKLLWDADNLYVAFNVSDTQVETSSADDTWDSDSVSIWLSSGLPTDGCVHPAECRKEYRQGPCEGGSSMPGIDPAWSLKPATTCGNDADNDAGYWVEMRIPWKDLQVAPVAGLVLSADLLSVDHDNNPGGRYDAPGTIFSKIFWDGDGPDYLRGAVRLVR